MKALKGVTKEKLSAMIGDKNQLSSVKNSAAAKKVDFSWENDSLESLNMLGNKFFTKDDSCFLLAWAGGDWEVPVHFILYVNSKGKLAIHIPRLGNTYNKDNNKALNNEPEADYSYLCRSLKFIGDREWAHYYDMLEEDDLDELSLEDLGNIYSDDKMIAEFLQKVDLI